MEYIFAASNSKKSFYRHYTIPKNNGKTREIAEPLPSLKEIQRWILENILERVPIHSVAKAYVKHLSILDNARFHKGQDLVLKMDIRDFFPSIRAKYVNAIFVRLGYSRQLSKLLTEIVTLNNCLPQGAPTSPALSNIVMYGVDRRIFGYITSKGLRYTRYADDMTISGEFNPAEVISFVEKVILDVGFKINREKTRVIRKSSRQLVTGVVVNDKCQAPKEIKRKLRQELFYIKKYGLDGHLCKLGEVRTNYIEHLLGISNYILQVNPKDSFAMEARGFLREVRGNGAGGGT